MSGVATVVAGTALIGSIASSESARNAARAQDQAATAANQQQSTLYGQGREDQKPWLDSGKANLAKLNDQMPDLTRKFTMDDFQEQPGYQFQLHQGQQSIERSAAAKGFLNSTGTMKNLDNYSQGVANQSYQQALQNFTANQNQRYTMLAGLANSGQVTGQSLAGQGQNYANQFGGNLNAGANANAAGSIAQGNAFNGALSTGANAYMGQSMMNRMYPQTPTTTAPSSGGWGGASTSGADWGGASGVVPVAD